MIYKLQIISLSGRLKVHTTSLIPSLFIEVSVPSQESDRSSICVLGPSKLPLFPWFLY